MKKILLLGLLTLSLQCYSQPSIYLSGGISTNTISKELKPGSMAISPMAEMGYRLNLKGYAFLGASIRYGELAISSPGWHTTATGADSLGGANERHPLVKNIITPMVILGAAFTLNKTSIYPGLEVGVNFKEQFGKTNITPVFGVRVDFVQSLSSRVGLLLGMSGTRYLIKGSKAWYFPLRAGVNFQI